MGAGNCNPCASLHSEYACPGSCTIRTICLPYSIRLNAPLIMTVYCGTPERFTANKSELTPWSFVLSCSPFFHFYSTEPFQLPYLPVLPWTAGEAEDDGVVDVVDVVDAEGAAFTRCAYASISCVCGCVERMAT